MNTLSHVNSRGEASMVDVSAKPIVLREAVARGEIRLQKATLQLIERNKIAVAAAGAENIPSTICLR